LGVCGAQGMTGLLFALLVMVLMTPMARAAWWLACRCIEDGDRPGDARTSVSRGLDQSIVVEVENSSGESIVVGWDVRPRMTPDCLQVLTSTLVIRALRRSERRRADGGASGFLGAVEAHTARSWHLPAPTVSSRILLILGQPGGRGRVHDYAVPDLPSSSGVGPSRRPSNFHGGYARWGRR